MTTPATLPNDHDSVLLGRGAPNVKALAASLQATAAAACPGVRVDPAISGTGVMFTAPGKGKKAMAAVAAAKKAVSEVLLARFPGQGMRHARHHGYLAWHVYGEQYGYVCSVRCGIEWGAS